MPSTVVKYQANRRSFVNQITKHRYRGLARVLKETHYPNYLPPYGLGKRLGPAGLKAGAKVDQAVQHLIEGKKIKPGWHAKLARRVIAMLKKNNWTSLRAQHVVWNDRLNLATAVDIMGRVGKQKTIRLIELKYSSHSLAKFKRCYKKTNPQTRYMKAIGLANSLYNQYQLQARRTAELFMHTHDKKKSQLLVGVLVICADGGMAHSQVKL